MKSTMITMSLALLPLLSSVVAHPLHHHRRALKIVTVTSEVVSTVFVTSTSYVDELPSATPEAVTTTTDSTPVPAVAPTTTETPTIVTPTTSEIPVFTPSPVPTTTEAPQVFVAPPSTSETPVVQAPPTTQAPPPPPSTTQAPPPPPTTEAPPPPPVVVSTPEPVPTSSAVPAPPSSGSGVGDHSGDGTFYATGLGSCGITSSDTDMIAALGFKTMDLTLGANPNNNPMCGRKVKAFSATNTEGVIVTIVDTCAGCAGAFDLDFSPAAFDLLGSEAQGRIPITWEFL